PPQAVLGCVENVLVPVDEASRIGHSENRRELASCGVSFVLDLDLESQTSRRTQACQQRGSRLDPPYGCRESDLLRNHREAIAAMDFFTVPTLTFGVLYCFFVIGHDRRKILHLNVTRNPSALWVVQQLREAWAYKQPHRFLLFDRDTKFGADVVSAVRD